MQPQQPQLDPTILNLTKAIRKAEGFNGDPNIRGKAGEWGAYQFMEGTWDRYAKELGVNAKWGQASLAQQNEVAYKKFKQWKDAGYNVGQIASMWNAGEGRPNAYAEGWRKVDPKTGEVIFDTPAYAQKVATEYQRLKAESGGQATPPLYQQQGGQTPPLNQQVPAVNPPTLEETKQKLQAKRDLKVEDPAEKGFGRKAAEFLFPILEDKDRTVTQAVADTALSVATLIPGGGAIGLGAKTAMQGGKGVLKSILPKLMNKSTVAKGGGLGYGYDVLSNLSEGETDAGEVLKPGVGTFLGAGAPIVSRGFKGTKVAQKALDEDAMDKAMDIVAPNITKKNAKGAIKKGLVGRGGATGGRIEMGADTRQTKAAESLKDLIKRGALKATDTVDSKAQVVRAEIADTAELLERQLKETESLPIKREELDDLLNKTKEIFEESPALVGDAGKSAERIYKKFTSFLPSDGDVTAADILKARKKLDVWIQSEGRGNSFNPTLETAISKGLREIRQGANELIAKKAPNVEVANMLRKQSSLYDALESIAENEWKQVGTTRTGRFLKRNPGTKAALGTVAASIGSGVGGAIGTTYVMNKLNQD